MAPERRSNAAGPDTETSVQKGRAGRLMMQTLVNDGQCYRETETDRKGKREREREEEKKILLELIASSLCRDDKQKDYGVHFSGVTLFLPDFIPGADQ